MKQDEWTVAKQYIPHNWEDAVHEYETDPFTRAIVGYLASMERARESYWLWNHRGGLIEVPYPFLGETAPEYYRGKYPDPVYTNTPPAGLNEGEDYHS